MNRGKRSTIGFTLIELLIVVAIIGILAAIAIPNFLEAQTRAKVAACLSGMRTVATALEAYRVDNTEYPRAVPHGFHTWVFCNYMRSYYEPNDYEIGTWELTTPVSYLSTIEWDPFGSTMDQTYDKHSYSYTNFESMHIHADEGDWTWKESYGPRPSIHLDYYSPQTIATSWLLIANGPDHVQSFAWISLGPGMEALVNRTDDLFVIYDPTNGTVSRGDIFRTQ